MSYPGGKAAVYQHIINQMPPHNTYVEPFLGGGAVLLNKRAAQTNIGVDLDANAIEQVRDLIVNSDGASASSALAMTSNHVIFSDDTGHIVINGGDCRNETAFTHFHNTDALRYLDLTLGRNDRETLIYCDPPYLRSVRSCQRPIYIHEFWTEQQHTELLKLLKSFTCMVMISGYWSELYADRLADWRTVTYPAVKRSGEVATEWLWCNYPEPQRLHDYSHLGENFRERERIKRKKQRWVSRLRAMPRLERLAIIAAIDEAIGGQGG